PSEACDRAARDRRRRARSGGDAARADGARRAPREDARPLAHRRSRAGDRRLGRERPVAARPRAREDRAPLGRRADRGARGPGRPRGRARAHCVRARGRDPRPPDRKGRGRAARAPPPGGAGRARRRAARRRAPLAPSRARAPRLRARRGSRAPRLRRRARVLRRAAREELSPGRARGGARRPAPGRRRGEDGGGRSRGAPRELAARARAPGRVALTQPLASLAALFASREIRRDALFRCSTPFATALSRPRAASATAWLAPVASPPSMAVRARFTSERTRVRTRWLRAARLTDWRCLFSADGWLAIRSPEIDPRG